MDKIQKIREEVERQRNLLTYIESWQKEPVKDRLTFKAIPRLLDMIEPSERAKNYVTKLADTFDAEGYHTDAKIVRESLKIMNGEKVPMATMDEESVNKDLEEAAFDYAEACKYDGCEKLLCVEHFKAGAKWQKEQMMKDAIEIEGGEIHLNYANAIISKGTAPFEKCKVKMIIIKEDKDE